MGRKRIWPRLVDEIIARIERGDDPVFRAGAKIPSDRMLMVQLGVARETVREVKRELVERGVLIAAWRGLKVRPKEFMSEGPLFRRGRLGPLEALDAYATWQAAICMAAVRHAAHRLPDEGLPEGVVPAGGIGTENRKALARRRFKMIEGFFKAYEHAVASEGLSRIGVTFRRYVATHYRPYVEGHYRPKTFMEVVGDEWPDWPGWTEQDRADNEIASDSDWSKTLGDCGITAMLLTEYAGRAELSTVSEAGIRSQIALILGLVDKPVADLVRQWTGTRAHSEAPARAVRELRTLRDMIITEAPPFVNGAVVPPATRLTEFLNCSLYKADTVCKVLREEGWIVGDITSARVGPRELWLQNDVFDGVRVDGSDFDATMAVLGVLFRRLLADLYRRDGERRKAAAGVGLKAVEALEALGNGQWSDGKWIATGFDSARAVQLLERAVGLLAWSNGDAALTEAMVLALRYMLLAYGDVLEQVFRNPRSHWLIGRALREEFERLQLGFAPLGLRDEVDGVRRYSSFFEELGSFIDAERASVFTVRILGDLADK